MSGAYFKALFAFRTLEQLLGGSQGYPVRLPRSAAGGESVQTFTPDAVRWLHTHLGAVLEEMDGERRRWFGDFAEAIEQLSVSELDCLGEEMNCSNQEINAVYRAVRGRRAVQENGIPSAPSCPAAEKLRESVSLKVGDRVDVFGRVLPVQAVTGWVEGLLPDPAPLEPLRGYDHTYSLGNMERLVVTDVIASEMDGDGGWHLFTRSGARWRVPVGWVWMSVRPHSAA